MAKATSIIANRGVMIKPRLFKGSREFNNSEFSYSEPVTQGKLNIQQEWFDFVIDAMVEVNKSGTASSVFGTSPFPIAGKTGTAQVFTIKQDEEYDSEKVPERLKDHSLYIGFAPVDEPKIALAVVVENGGFGVTTATPIAKLVFELLPSEKTLINLGVKKITIVPKPVSFIFKNLDRPLSIMILGVSIISCFAVYSSSHDEIIRFYQHLRNILIAGLLIIFLSHIPSVIIEKFAIPAYITTILLLLATEFFGETVNGATRWINLGFITGQPSEILKISLPLLLAWFVQKSEGLNSKRDWAFVLLLFLLPLIMVLRQPDLGTSNFIIYFRNHSSFFCWFALESYCNWPNAFCSFFVNFTYFRR